MFLNAAKSLPGQDIVEGDVCLDVGVKMGQLDDGHLGGGDGQHVPHAAHPLQLLSQRLDQLLTVVIGARNGCKIIRRIQIGTVPNKFIG